MDSLKVTDQALAAAAVAPRVALSDITSAVGHVYYTTGELALEKNPGLDENRRQLGILTLCFVVMKNGFIVVGKSAPASPDNYRSDIGQQLAYEDCIRQLWPLMGFALRDKLHAAAGPHY